MPKTQKRNCVLPDYSHLLIEVPPVQELTRDLVFSRVVDLLYAYADYSPVARPAQAGDQVMISYQAQSEQHWIPGCFAIDQKVLMSEDMILPGVFDQLLGMSAGQSKAFALTLPTDFEPSEFANQSVNIQIELKQVYLPHLPDSSDDFAQKTQLGANLSELIKSLTQTLFEEFQLDWKRFVSELLVDALIKDAELTHEEDRCQMELRQMWLQREGHLMQKHQVGEELIKASWQSWLSSPSLLAEATRRIQRTRVLHALAEQEGLAVTPDELAILLEPFCQRFAQSPTAVYDELKESGQLEVLLLQLEAEKAIDFLFNHADLVMSSDLA